MNEFKAILRVQWARSRMLVTVFALACFGLPLFIIGQRFTNAYDRYLSVGRFLELADMVGRAFPLLALSLGVVAGVMAWADDQRMGHVYALSLPMARERYVLLRFAATGLTLLLPVAGLLAGGLIASSVVVLPSGIHAYPLTLTARFALALAACFSVFFALAGATRRAARVVALLLVALIVGDLSLMMFDAGFSLTGSLLEGATRWPSPFELLTGSWALFNA